MELISVIVPVYNVSSYLEECLDSLCAQTYSSLEILVIDDGSTDASSDICDRYAAKDQRIRVYHKMNGGLSEARNYGLERMTGEYVSFVDSDDYVEPDYIEHLYYLLKKYEADISMASAYFVENGRKRIVDTDGVEIVDVYTAEEVMRAFYHRSGVWQPIYTIAWAKLYHKKHFETLRYPVGKIHEDEFTTYKTFLASKKIVFHNKATYAYRQRENSIMQAEYNIKAVDVLEALQERLYILKDLGYDLLDTKYSYIANLARNRYHLKRNGYLELYKQINQIYQSLFWEYFKDMPWQRRFKMLLSRWAYGFFYVHLKKAS